MQAILNQAKTQALLSNSRINIYQLTSGTYVSAPDGYNIPEGATKIGYVDRNGQYIEHTDTTGIQGDSDDEGAISHPRHR